LVPIGCSAILALMAAKCHVLLGKKHKDDPDRFGDRDVDRCHVRGHADKRKISEPGPQPGQLTVIAFNLLRLIYCAGGSAIC
jgi:hypothetical protein